MLSVEVIKSSGIVKNVIGFAKVQEQVKNRKQQHFGSYTTS